YINIPIALISMGLVIKYFNFEQDTIEKTRLDYKGLIVFYGAVASFLCIVSEQVPSIVRILSIVTLIVFIFLLFKLEKKFKNPFVPIPSIKKKILLELLTDLIYSQMMMRYTKFIHIYLNKKQHFTTS